MKKIVILSASLRKNSNSEILANECARGARDAGNEVELIRLKEHKIGFCIGCLACAETGRCAQKDDAAELAEKVKTADTVVFATPIYYYEMSGQLKTFLDRMNPLYGKEYRFRHVYLIATAADGGEHTFARAYNGLGGWVECFDKATLDGLLTGDEIDEAGKAQTVPELLTKAYTFGQNLQ